MNYLFKNLALVCAVLLWSCTSPDDVVDYSDLGPDLPETGSTPSYNEERNVYFGDLHVHTKHSFDAFIF